MSEESQPSGRPSIAPRDLARFVVGAGGALPLAAERATRKLNTKVTEYDIIELVTENDDISERIASQLRSLLLIRMFDVIMQLQIGVSASIEDMKPGEMARTYTALISSFASLTAPSPKSMLDLLDVATKTADELDIDPVSVLRDMEKLLSRRRA